MTKIYTTGTWTPNEGAEHAFAAAWAEFASWASGMPGAGTLRLTRDIHDERRFVSFGDWADLERVRAWKSSPEFRERMARVLQHVEAFEPTELEVVTKVASGETMAAAL